MPLNRLDFKKKIQPKTIKTHSGKQSTKVNHEAEEKLLRGNNFQGGLLSENMSNDISISPDVPHKDTWNDAWLLISCKTPEHGELGRSRY